MLGTVFETINVNPSARGNKQTKKPNKNELLVYLDDKSHLDFYFLRQRLCLPKRTAEEKVPRKRKGKTLAVKCMFIK